MHEKITHTTNIFDGRVVHLKVHDVTLPDGNTAKRELIHHNGAVAIVALNADNHILLVKQFRIGANKIMLEIPAGLLEPEEDPLAAVQRELQEETGYRPTDPQPIGGFYVAAGYTTEYIHLYYATHLIHDPLPQDDDEFIEMITMPLSQALQAITDGIIQDAKTIIALTRYAQITT